MFFQWVLAAALALAWAVIMPWIFFLQPPYALLDGQGAGWHYEA